MIGRAALRGPLGLSLISLAALLVVIIWHIGPVLGAVMRPNLSDDTTGEQLQARLDEHEAYIQTYRDRVAGRSFFVEPKPWPRVRTPAPPPMTRDDEPEDQTPSIPTSYAGRLQPLFPIGNMVYFDDREDDNEIVEPRILFVGEEREGVKLVAINPPRTVTLAWKGGEYDVQFFQNLDWSKDPAYFKPKHKDTVPGLRQRPPSTEDEDETAAVPAGSEGPSDPDAAAETAGREDSPDSSKSAVANLEGLKAPGNVDPAGPDGAIDPKNQSRSDRNDDQGEEK